jgi:hypothetical protein
MNAQPVPALEKRRALAAYLAAQREAETSQGWNDYLREQTYRAERYEPVQERAELPKPSCWQLIREEYRDNPAAFLFAGLFWLIVLGIGLVMLAVRQGWVS